MHDEPRHGSEEKFRSIFERADMGIVTGDPSGAFLDINPKFSQLLGYSPDELKGRSYLDFTHPDDRERCQRLVADLLAERIPYFSVEKRYLRKGGSPLWVKEIVAPLPGGEGQPLSLLAMVEDISERVETVAALERARGELEERVCERTRELTRANEVLNEAQALAHMGNWEWEVDTDRVTWSDELYRIYGQTPGSFGATFEAFLAQIVPEDRELVRRTVLEALESAGAYRIEERILRPDGSQRVLSSTGRAVSDPQGRVVKLQGTCLDITDYREAIRKIQELNAELERRVAERTQQLAAANHELEAFSYSVSHDLRAPLRSIDGFSQALLEDYHDRLDDVGKDYLRRVRAASQHMATLIDDMLKLSRLTRGDLHRARVDLSRLARDAIEHLIRREPDRQVEVAIEEGVVACGDASLLGAVLQNLLENSWKFTRRHARARIAFGRTQRDGKPAYYVQDDGAGFDMAYRDKLFKPFSRLHGQAEFEGTGIGLATVQRIIHKHGGNIWVDAAVERGATFTFTLDEETCA